MHKVVIIEEFEVKAKEIMFHTRGEAINLADTIHAHEVKVYDEFEQIIFHKKLEIEETYA